MTSVTVTRYTLGMCLVCGCGHPYDNHGDAMNLTKSRLNLMASRNQISPLEAAENILGTIKGAITPENPRHTKDRYTLRVERDMAARRKDVADSRKRSPEPDSSRLPAKPKEVMSIESTGKKRPQ